jgi:hypothetical protein
MQNARTGLPSGVSTTSRRAAPPTARTNSHTPSRQSWSSTSRRSKSKSIEAGPNRNRFTSTPRVGRTLMTIAQPHRTTTRQAVNGATTCRSPALHPVRSLYRPSIHLGRLAVGGEPALPMSADGQGTETTQRPTPPNATWTTPLVAVTMMSGNPPVSNVPRRGHASVVSSATSSWMQLTNIQTFVSTGFSGNHPTWVGPAPKRSKPTVSESTTVNAIGTPPTRSSSRASTVSDAALSKASAYFTRQPYRPRLKQRFASASSIDVGSPPRIEAFAGRSHEVTRRYASWPIGENPGPVDPQRLTRPIAHLVAMGGRATGRRRRLRARCRSDASARRSTGRGAQHLDHPLARLVQIG